MKKRIFRAILVVAVAVLLASLGLVVGVLHLYFEDRVTEELGQTISYIAHGVENEGIAYLQEGLPGEDRITWVAEDGSVLFDNREQAANMANHADREEIREAMQQGRGTAVRYSDTLSQRTIYYALRLTDGTVLRLAAAQYSVWMLILQVLRPMLVMLAVIFCLAMWLAGRLAKQLVAPINAIDLNNPTDNLDYEELSPLVSRIRAQNQQIRQHVEALHRRQEEFRAITAHMSEGLLVIDREANVLSFNHAALRLLGVGCMVEEGCAVLELSQDAGFRRCVEEALAGRRCETLLERADTSCRVFANPVEQGGKRTGAVLIAMDVTETEQRETLRREFTANVSHELKTPLTSILGTAEILENGLVKPEDIPHFAGNIHTEAKRLIGLVNDIIKISRLDEGSPAAQWEQVELRSVMESVKAQLELAAERKHVQINLLGSSAVVRGVPQIVEEVIYNLCDNAIAYNVPGGKVDMTVINSVDGPRVIVADTGVGIAPEVQNRVFERFYRVDKSHSGGGTGLGLSIVKHGAAYLGARVELVSAPGKGSTFTLTFPKNKP